MPTGQHKNSRDNLKKGVATQLKKGDPRTVALGRKGGLKSGEVKAKQRTFKAILHNIMAEPVPENIAKEFKKNYGRNAENMAEALALRVYMETLLDGSSKSFAIIRDSVGEKPTDVVEQSVVNEYSRQHMRNKLLSQMMKNKKPKPKKTTKKSKKD